MPPKTTKKPARKAKPKFEFSRKQREAITEVLSDLRDACDDNDDLALACITGEGSTKKVVKLLEDQEEGEIDYAIGYAHAICDLAGIKAEKLLAEFPAEDEEGDDDADDEDEDFVEDDEDDEDESEDDEKPRARRKKK